MDPSFKIRLETHHEVVSSSIAHARWHFRLEKVDGPNFSEEAYGPTNHITPSIKMSRHHKSLYLTAISTEMAIIGAVRDTLCNRVIDLPFKANVIIFQSVLLWHVYKQGFAEGKTFFFSGNLSNLCETQWLCTQEVWLMYYDAFSISSGGDGYTLGCRWKLHRLWGRKWKCHPLQHEFTPRRRQKVIVFGGLADLVNSNGRRRRRGGQRAQPYMSFLFLWCPIKLWKGWKWMAGMGSPRDTMVTEERGNLISLEMLILWSTI